MKPYWVSTDGMIQVYHSRMEDALAAGIVPVREVALVHADPPYGTRQDFARGGEAGSPRRSAKISGGKVRQFPPCIGDDTPYDPSPILALGRPTVTWGANHYASRLPDSAAGIVWDKREEFGSDDGSDCEVAWSNIGGSLRLFRHYWRGAIRKTEKLDRHLHVNQKPIALSTYVFTEHARLKRGDLVFVPHGGSGPDLPAAVAMGLRLIWCDAEQWCCDTAIARLGAVTAERAAEPAGPLFAGLR